MFVQCQPSSVNLAIATLSALLRYAEREKVIERAVKLTYLKAPPPKPVFYDDETFLRLWRASRVVDERWGGNHELLLLLGGDAGLRCGELLALEPRHLRVKGEAVVIEINEYQKVIGTPKGGSAEDVPISRRLREAIQRADLTGPRVFRRVMVGHNKIKDPVASENALRAILRRVQREAGLPTTGKLHTLRHTLCTRLAMAGAPTRAIQGVARHKRLATTEKYMHLVDGAKAKAVALLDGSDEPEDLSNGCPTDHDEVK